MAKKKDPLKEFSNEQLIQELIKRGKKRVEEYEVEAECAQVEADQIQEMIDNLQEIVLE